MATMSNTFNTTVPLIGRLQRFSGRLTANVAFGLVILRLNLLLAVFITVWASNWSIPVWLVWALLIALPSWSMAVMLSPYLQSQAVPEFRELAIDIAWVGILVFFSGGAENPFIYYYLVITALAAIVLSQPGAWFVCAVCAAIYSVLLGIDVSAHFHHLSDGYKSHLIGMWFNYVGSSVVLCFFLTRLVKLTRKQQRDIDLIREQNLKNEQLIGLATVSASTVHQLATPLATLNLLIDELKQKDWDAEQQADIAMMHEQIRLCRLTMDDLSALAQASQHTSSVCLNALIDDVREHFTVSAAEHIPVIKHHTSEDIHIVCNPLLKYALINLLNNALASSDGIVEITLSENEQRVFIDIENTSTQSQADLDKRWGKPTQSTKSDGLGIGSFLANTTIEQQGGQVRFSVTPGKQPGVNQVKVTVGLPRLGTT